MHSVVFPQIIACGLLSDILQCVPYCLLPLQCHYTIEIIHYTLCIIYDTLYTIHYTLYMNYTLYLLCPIVYLRNNAMWSLLTIGCLQDCFSALTCLGHIVHYTSYIKHDTS